MAQADLPIDVMDSNPLENWEILTEIVLALVSKPDSVRVEQKLEKDTIHLDIHVAPEDVGKVIGKNGDTVLLLRKLFSRIAWTRGKKVFIEVIEPGRTRHRASKQRPRDSDVAA